MMLTWLADTLTQAGLVVVPYDGWETRTTRAGGLEVRGIVCHHTATGPTTSNTAVARLLANGRSDLKGPLAQLGLDRDGHYWLIAAGRANGNGYGTWGNDSINIEAFNDGVGEPWPAVQVDAYERGCAALAHRCGLSIAEVRGHKETDPHRKVDPRGIDMDLFRAHVAAHLNPPEDDMIRIVNLTDPDNPGAGTHTYAVSGVVGRHMQRDEDIGELLGRFGAVDERPKGTTSSIMFALANGPLKTP